MQMGEGGNILMANRAPRQLPPLAPGTCVRVQNQASNVWDHTGLVVEALLHKQYIIRLDSSGRMSLRNRRHLRPTSVPTPPPAQSEAPLPTTQTPTPPPPQPHPKRQVKRPRWLDDYV
ncbi:hypothetical protein E2C01_021400 [Portunus trituberculatus]|uniref:Uncharacterized protein n=1 Tax=Portunus trituberculatus TaxID=210409 RepID=A0A5B7E5Z3_PORTR|nr:hypothetical protein [Portunus trituberculatus]